MGDDSKIFPVGFSIDGDFDYNRTISLLDERVFGLEKKERRILGVIANLGPLNGNQLYQLARKEHADLTADVVRYAVYDKKNPRNLTALKFLTKRKGDRVGNFKKDLKYETIYSLTLKGFLASLSELSFENNYMVKKYVEFIEHYCGFIPHISEFVIQAVKYDVTLFLFDQYYKGSILKESKNIRSLISEFHNLIQYVPPRRPFLDLKEGDEKLFKEIMSRYWLTSNLLRNIQNVGTKKYVDTIGLLDPVCEWYEYFENIQNYSKFDGKFTKYRREETGDSYEIDENSIYTKAKKILENYGINDYIKVSDFWG